MNFEVIIVSGYHSGKKGVVTEMTLDKFFIFVKIYGEDVIAFSVDQIKKI